MIDKKYKFTVFTATFNRGSFLKRVYKSLLAQSYKDFEWLIVDDGSSDDTESIVQEFIAFGMMPIRYFKQINSGKHVAINLGVREALGELFLILDSDDACVSNALERFIYHWNKVDKNNFSGVFANCMSSTNKLVGSRFPQDIFDANFIDIYYKYNTTGDKWGFFRTDILKEYPFPVFFNEKFLTEAIIWNKIALKYRTRFVNESLLLADYQSDGLSGRSLELRINNPLGAVSYYQDFLKLPVSFYWKIRNLLNYIRFSLHGNMDVVKKFSDLDGCWRFFYILVFPLGYLIYLRDKFI